MKKQFSKKRTLFGKDHGFNLKDSEYNDFKFAMPPEDQTGSRDVVDEMLLDGLKLATDSHLNADEYDYEHYHNLKIRLKLSRHEVDEEDINEAQHLGNDGSLYSKTIKEEIDSDDEYCADGTIE